MKQNKKKSGLRARNLDRTNRSIKNHTCNLFALAEFMVAMLIVLVVDTLSIITFIFPVIN